MQEYLAFVDEIGRSGDGGFIYRLDFTQNTDVVWGEYFNMAPAIMVPGLSPDINCLSSRAKVVFPREMMIAKRNSCFSMQDCIDGIIAMFFSEIDEDTIEVNGEPFSVWFGDTIESVNEKLKLLNIAPFDVEQIENGDESAIDKLIDGDILDNDLNGDDF